MARIVLVKAGYRSVRQHYAPPLGVMSLAAFLRDRVPGLEIKIIDMLQRDMSAQSVAKEALEFEPDLVGLSAMSYEARDMADVSAAVKRLKLEVPVVAGGPHASTAPDKALLDPNLDYVVKGEGEITTLELIERVVAGQGSPGEIEGLGYKSGGEIVVNKPREETVDLDAIPLPAYDLIDLEAYWDLPRFGTTYARKQYASLATSRSCPYRCTYCHRIFGTKFRAQSADKVLSDMAELRDRFGVREILFVDDCFNLKKKRLVDICDGVAERGLDFTIAFPNGIRGDIMTPELLGKLKKAGTYRITYAVETASPRLQKFIKKHVQLEKLKKVIEWTDRLDIMVDGFFMVGFPGETEAEIDLTLDYALESRLHTANFWFVTPFKGTELYEQAREMGLTPVETEEDAEAMHYFDPATDLSEVPAAVLKKKVQRTFLRFYLSPWRVWRIARLFPNKAQLPELFIRFLKISATWKS